MRAELQGVLIEARELPVDQLPRLIGDLEEIKAMAMARLTAPAPPSQADELLDVQAASKRLGLSCDFLYHHHQRFPFTRRMGRKLLFSSLGIDVYIRQNRAKSRA
jgi:hypothetical protein